VGEEITMPSRQLTLEVLETTSEHIEPGEFAPHRADVHQKEDRNQTRTGESQAAEGRCPRMRVLIADSDASLLESYLEYLDSRGFDVAIATNGLECLGKLREFIPHVLVLEPSLPWGGGDGVLAAMQEDAGLRGIPVIVLTYGRDCSALYRLAPYRVADYLIKPQPPRRLVERIETLGDRNARPARGTPSEARETQVAKPDRPG
jgi:DNA-binding NtrC family response regulator